MRHDESKIALTATAIAEVHRALGAAATEEFLAPERARTNVVGIGAGVKWKNGQPTGEPALLVLVTQKVERGQLSATELVPERLADMQTDVLAIGYPFAGESEAFAAGSQTLARRVRPAEGGYSVGHINITAGTIATCVYDILPGGTVSPPAHGVGIPPKYYILSNNHVSPTLTLAPPATLFSSLAPSTVGLTQRTESRP